MIDVRVLGDDLGGAIDGAGLLEHLRRRGDGAVVLGREVRDALPGLGRGSEVVALLLLEGRELLLERDALLEVTLGRGLLLEQVGEVVPALRLLEQARERLARAVVAAVDRQQLLPRVDGAVGVAQVALAEAGHLAQPLLSGLDRLAGRAHRGEQHVAQRGVVALGAQVVLDPGERLGVGRIGFEHLSVLRVGLGALVLVASICAASRTPCSLSAGSGSARGALEASRTPWRARRLGRCAAASGLRRGRGHGRHGLAELPVELADLFGGLGIARPRSGSRIWTALSS